MATQTTANFCDSSTAANFRAWASMISTALSTAGFVQTADTGQINLATVAAPGSGFTSQGYQVWGFNDTLQATFPFYFKIEYGSGSGFSPGIWLTFGTGTNGSGTLTGQLASRFVMTGATANTSAQQNSYFSYGTNGSRFVMDCFDGPNTLYQFLVGWERTVDATGAANSDGLVVYATIGTNASPGAFTTNNGSSCGMFVLPSSGTIPTPQSYWPVAYPSQTTGLSLSDGTNASLVFPTPIGFRAYNPVYNVAFYMGTDFAYYQTISNVPAYGTNHTYKTIGTTAAGSSALPYGKNQSGTQMLPGIAIRWE